MTHNQALKALNIPTSVKERDVNPLDVAVDYFFGSKRLDYREAAITQCVDNGVDFQSEDNTISNLLDRYVRLACPHCKETMTSFSSGGSTQVHQHDYVCTKCKVHIVLSVPNDGLSFEFLG